MPTCSTISLGSWCVRIRADHLGWVPSTAARARRDRKCRDLERCARDRCWFPLLLSRMERAKVKIVAVRASFETNASTPQHGVAVAKQVETRGTDLLASSFRFAPADDLPRTCLLRKRIADGPHGPYKMLSASLIEGRKWPMWTSTVRGPT